MGRSIHTTRRDLIREKKSQYSNPEARRQRLAEIRKELDAKRSIKRAIRRERQLEPSETELVADAIDAIPIETVDQGPRIHYPASPDDLRGVMRRLPKGILAGLSKIRLCLGSDYFEERRPADPSSDPPRDPWLGRLSDEDLPGVFVGEILGTYYSDPASIDLYAYVYEALTEEPIVCSIFLRLQMLATFVHEVAHHDDCMQRQSRGRWRFSDEGKAEYYAESSAALLVRDCVAPYLRETYPAEVRALETWLLNHAGAAPPLESLAGKWAWDESGKPTLNWFFCSAFAFEELFRSVRQGNESISTRIEFANELHYAEHYAGALQILEQVLASAPDNVAALTLKADVFEHQERYDEAIDLAQGVVATAPEHIDAWWVLARSHAYRYRWNEALTAAERLSSLELASGSINNWTHELIVRALLELGRYAETERALESWESRPHGKDRAQALRMLLYYRTGRYAEALFLAEQPSRRSRPADKTLKCCIRWAAEKKLGRKPSRRAPSKRMLTWLQSLGFKNWVEEWNRDFS